jgi:hypothetical protein
MFSALPFIAFNVMVAVAIASNGFCLIFERKSGRLNKLVRYRPESGETRSLVLKAGYDGPGPPRIRTRFAEADFAEAHVDFIPYVES